MTRVTLAASHARDWLTRYDGEPPEILTIGPRLVTMVLDDDALADIKADAKHYGDVEAESWFGHEFTGLVQSARTNMRRLGVDFA